MNPNDPSTNPQPYTPPPQAGMPSGPLAQGSGQPGGSDMGFQPYPPVMPQSPVPGAPIGQVNNSQQAPYNPANSGGSNQQYTNANTSPSSFTQNSYGPFPPPGATAMPSPSMPPIGGTPSGSNPAPSSNVRQEVIEHLKKANNVLVTVSSNPSVDQLSSAIAITLVLNKLNKHATAVYSGKTPSTLEFLQPEKTIEKNTDSLRDFIIALDKAKADKLRYKVEDQFVKIFITPYHTSINEEDLEFSQGDFNVDVVLAIGVHQKTELDQAITAHGRILHDAVTISINNNKPAELGTINWFQADASSLSEMLVGLIEPLQGDKILLDNQIATSFLTGVVAETERFSNNKTTPRTMNVSATLMKAGANQQLVASKLQEPEPLPEEFDKEKLDKLAKDKDETNPHPAPIPSKDGSLAIEHKPSEAVKKSSKTLTELEKENNSTSDESDEYGNLAKIHIDEQGGLHVAGEEPKPEPAQTQEQSKPSNMILDKPSIGGDLSSATREDTPASAIPAVDTPPADKETTLTRAKTIEPLPTGSSPNTLSDIEAAVHSPHIAKVDTADNGNQDDDTNTSQAREEVKKASTFSNSQRLEPIAALNATPVDLKTNNTDTSPSPVEPEKPKSSDLTNEEVFPPKLVGPDKGPGPDPTAASNDSPGSPPPVPPPIIPSS